MKTLKQMWGIEPWATALTFASLVIITYLLWGYLGWRGIFVATGPPLFAFVWFRVGQRHIAMQVQAIIENKEEP